MILPVPLLVLFLSLSTWAVESVSDDGKEDESSACGTGGTTCDPKAKFRTYDGSCNNLDHPTWGSARSLYSRIIPSRFEDRKYRFYFL